MWEEKATPVGTSTVKPNYDIRSKYAKYSFGDKERHSYGSFWSWIFVRALRSFMIVVKTFCVVKPQYNFN